MTVCISATCESGRCIVVAADRMFTLSAPISLEFETGEKKIDPIGASCVALTAGNSSFGTEILVAAGSALSGNQRPLIEMAAETIKASYITIRATKVRETIVIPLLGPDYLKHEQLGQSVAKYLESQQAMFQNIVVQANNLNLGTEFLVAGIDANGARLAYVGHPGTIFWLDKLGYGAIGSGAIHATTRLSLAGQTRASNLAETFYRVYEAKRASEVAPGVGDKFTDLAIIRPDRIIDCSPSTRTVLEQIFNNSRGNMMPDLSALRGVPELQP